MSNKQTRQPARVIVWQNDRVMVFDATGQQLPEYQGQLATVRERLAAVFPEKHWEKGNWREGRIGPWASPPTDLSPDA